MGLSLFSGLASAISFGVGPIAGMNLGNGSMEVPAGFTVKTEIRSGLALGARAELGVTSPFSLLLEPTYLQRGDVEKVTVFGQSITTETRLNYFEIPILAKAKFGAMKTHAYIFAGPSLGFFLNGEQESEGQTEKADSIATFNLSGDIGAGGSYQLQQYVYLNLDVRYSYGMLNTNDAGTRDDVEWYNRDIRIMACVLFHLTE